MKLSLHNLKKRFSIFTFFLCLYLFSAPLAKAQVVSIPIETNNTAIVLQTSENKDLKIIYFGKKLANAKEYNLVAGVYPADYTGISNSAYTPSGSRNLFEPAITVTHADENYGVLSQYLLLNEK